MRRRLGALATLALGTAVVAGCERAEPPRQQTNAPPQPAATPVALTAAQHETVPSALSFDVGEIKSASEYLRDPQFANADLRRGEILSLACAACHSFAAGQGTIIGPNLHGVFGRRAAAVVDFDYSPALRASALVWTPRALEAWLADPASFVAGTKMTFTGYRSAEDRRDLIAYLLRATD